MDKREHKYVLRPDTFPYKIRDVLKHSRFLRLACLNSLINRGYFRGWGHRGLLKKGDLKLFVQHTKTCWEKGKERERA